MAVNLGNYSDQLSLEDYDKALANSGYTPPPQSAPTQGNQFDTDSRANPYAASASAPLKQASDAERPPAYGGSYGSDIKDAFATGAGNKNGEKKGNNALGIVGKILAFL